MGLALFAFLAIALFFNNCSGPTAISNETSPSQLAAPVVAPIPGAVGTPSVPTAVTPNGPATAEKSRFKIVWLEPHNLNQNVYLRANIPTTAHIFEMFRNYKLLGVEKVVIAYSEYLSYYIYEPSDLLKTNYPPAQTVLKLRGGEPLLNVLFQAADLHGIKMLVGLSPFGDKNLVLRLEQDMHAARVFAPANIEALNRNVLLNQMLANDIFFKFKSHSSFYGWYLVQEPHCMDVALNYFSPIAKFVKSLDSSKKIMVSPNADAENCYGSSSSTNSEYIANTRAILFKAKEAGIDIVAYQDSMGAGYQPSVKQFPSFKGAWLEVLRPNLLPEQGFYHYSDLARAMRFNYLNNLILPSLKIAHETTGVEFWMNTELWRMDGNCGGQILAYGCAYGGLDFKTQLEGWSKITGNLMMNEGFSQFDFSYNTTDPISATNLGNQTGKPAYENAINFKINYQSYLGL